MSYATECRLVSAAPAASPCRAQHKCLNADHLSAQKLAAAIDGRRSMPPQVCARRCQGASLRSARMKVGGLRALTAPARRPVLATA